MEQGVAPCRRGERSHVPGCDAIVRPDEGPPSVAGRDRVKGRSNAALGKGTSRTVRSKLVWWYRTKSPRRSAGGRACPSPGAGGAPRQGAPESAPSGAPPPSGGGVQDPRQGEQAT